MRLQSILSAIGICALLATSAFGQLEGLLSGDGAGGDPKFTAKLYAVEGTSEGYLEFTMEVPEGWKVYDVTETPGGIGVPATMKLPDPAKTKAPNGFEITDEWVADHEPKMVEEDGDLHPVHYGTVTWKAPVKFEEGVNPKNLKTKIKFTGQICATSCRPLSEQVAVQFEGYVKKDPSSSNSTGGKKAKKETPEVKSGGPKEPKADKSRLDETDSKAVSLKLGPPSTLRTFGDEPAFSANLYMVKGGAEGVIEVSMAIPKGWQTYDVTEAKEGAGLPSEIYLYAARKDKKGTTKPSEYELSGPWIADRSPTIAEENGESHLVHVGNAIWRSRVKFSEGVDAKSLPIKVFYYGQVCTIEPGKCKQVESESKVQYAGDLSDENLSKLPLFGEDRDVSTEAPSGTIESSESPRVLASTDVLDNLDIQGLEGRRTQYSFPTIILFALAGGFILNFMPCVLPVIGLKIASFVEQAGESSGRIITLNIFYSLGLLSVFMVLATLTSFWSFGWGQQNQSLVFNVIMVSIVFAMGLSMIGVWEIPIPGLAMSTGANKLSQKEGPQGAFFKGVLTTILAVPCSGPGLATALLYCQDKPPQIIYAVFFFLALGMAAPYLVLGAFPSLVRFLPKPGAWMETFKQIMGFVLMGTVVYLMSFIPLEYLLSVVALLFGIWMACWYFGRVPAWESSNKRLVAAVVSIVIIGCVGAVSFMWLNHVMLERVERNSLRMADEINARVRKGEAVAANRLPWKSYSVSKLGKLTGEKKTVMIDFTADWCPTCKFLEKFVLNTPEAKEVVEENQIETLLADWTSLDDEIGETLQKLKSNKQIPVLAIFPADNPKKPIVLTGMYTQSELISALRKAGPSKAVEATVSVNPVDASKEVALRAKTGDVKKN